MKITTIILAAGQGKRMHSAKPKVLHEIAGKPLLQHVYETSRTLGDSKVVIVFGHGGEQVRQYCLFDDAVWVEQTQQLGTGHAVLQAIDYIDNSDKVLILYGDVPLIQPQTLNDLLNLVGEKSLGLLTVVLQDPTGYGRIIRNEDGAVVQIVEHKDATPEQLAIKEGNTGILAVQGHWLKQALGGLKNNNAQQEYYLTDIIEMAVQAGMVIHTQTVRTEEEVLGVNDRLQLARLERCYQLEQARQLMLKGVTLTDPARFDVRGHIESIGQDVEIDINAIIEGRVCIGDRVKIGANVMIKDSVIEDDVEILAHCVIENAIVGKGSRIGPFARLRPETQLADHVHIGNFVEIKKSKVDSGSKINHLSYIGDAEVGSQVNIGAGTITCNYDGANKFKTVIKDRAFIGSDTQLVAPVTVEEGATVGAGSTITKDCAAEKLTLSRSRQVQIDKWERPKKNT